MGAYNEQPLAPELQSSGLGAEDEESQFVCHRSTARINDLLNLPNRARPAPSSILARRSFYHRFLRSGFQALVLTDSLGAQR